MKNLKGIIQSAFKILNEYFKIDKLMDIWRTLKLNLFDHHYEHIM